MSEKSHVREACETVLVAAAMLAIATFIFERALEHAQCALGLFDNVAAFFTATMGIVVFFMAQTLLANVFISPVVRAHWPKHKFLRWAVTLLFALIGTLMMLTIIHVLDWPKKPVEGLVCGTPFDSIKVA